MRLLACEGILFDNDGVLVDSDASVLRAWSSWAVARGLDPAVVVPMVHGRKSRETVALLIAEPDRAAALADIDARELADATQVSALPGAVALIDSMPAERWAIVTSATRPLGSARLAAAGIQNPNCLVSADDVSRGKPDPEGYLAAASALGFPPSAVIVIEDSPAGILAARAAAVGAVVGVGERALSAGADVVVRDLRDVEWTETGLLVLASLSEAEQPS